MGSFEIMEARHSVRQYKDQAIEPEKHAGGHAGTDCDQSAKISVWTAGGRQLKNIPRPWILL